MSWSLVDIIGMLQNREYIAPNTLPTTLEGWVSSVVSQIGDKFSGLYYVDENYASKPVTVREASDIDGKKCGDILRYACMVTGTFARADASTGYLAVSPLWSEGNKITLDNLNDYPTIKANDDLAALIFTINDGNQTKITILGNSTFSGETKSIENPFIHTSDQAMSAAVSILSTYGGNKYEITGRGDPSSEIGDVDTIWLDESSATTARRIRQDFSYKNGVLMNCTSVLLQADLSVQYKNRIEISKSSVFTVPDDVTSIHFILVGKGENGGKGQDGDWEVTGEDGENGLGGKVFANTINVSPGQNIQVTIGTDTLFGSYSSANGIVYEYGYTDIASGKSYARSGVKSPISGTGDGGIGGAGGRAGWFHIEGGNPDTGHTGSIIPVVPTGTVVVDNYPGEGKPGSTGATGCAIIYYD